MTDDELSDALDTWRINYALHLEPPELHMFWLNMAPSGAVLALKATCEEIERLRTGMLKMRDDNAALMARVAELEALLKSLSANNHTPQSVTF